MPWELTKKGAYEWSGDLLRVAALIRHWYELDEANLKPFYPHPIEYTGKHAFYVASVIQQSWQYDPEKSNTDKFHVLTWHLFKYMDISEKADLEYKMMRILDLLDVVCDCMSVREILLIIFNGPLKPDKT